MKTFFSINFIFIDSVATNEAIDNAKNNLNNSIKKLDRFLLPNISVRVFFKNEEILELNKNIEMKDNIDNMNTIKNFTYT